MGSELRSHRRFVQYAFSRALEVAVNGEPWDGRHVNSALLGENTILFEYNDGSLLRIATTSDGYSVWTLVACGRRNSSLEVQK